MHTQGERSTPTAKHLRSPGNAPKLTGTHEEAREQARKSYIEPTPGTPVWVQHRQNATWEPAIVVNQGAPNYWIMQENGTEQ